MGGLRGSDEPLWVLSSAFHEQSDQLLPVKPKAINFTGVSISQLAVFSPSQWPSCQTPSLYLAGRKFYKGRYTSCCEISPFSRSQGANPSGHQYKLEKPQDFSNVYQFLGLEQSEHNSTAPALAAVGAGRFVLRQLC